jgi:CheY-like chemotaxis protein/HPt (histidine-containing phosphotransfer) domain-containing protein
MAVSDTGIGIAAESVPTLFDPFEQADLNKNRLLQGAGLGLTISKAIVEMMDGKISLESEYGKGSTFSVEVPKILGDKSLVPYQDSAEDAVYAPHADVLVVDDNLTNLNVASGLLRLFHIEADTAMSGSEAIDMIRKKQYDLVFMDHRMPVMSGVETTKQLRATGVNIPIVALTASAIVGAKEMMLAAGMNDYLWKPVVKKELVRILKKWIPAEKQLAIPAGLLAPDESARDENRDFWAKVDQIDKLSLSLGLERVEGQYDVYESSLKLIMLEIEKSNVNLEKFLLDGDMDNFRIEVHGMKGALANVGAMELSELSRVLENAASKNDPGFCSKKLPHLLRGLQNLYAGLQEAFETKKHDGVMRIPADMPGVLLMLREAIEDIDILLIDKAMDTLNALNLRGAIKDAVEPLKNAILIMDYDKATEQITQLLAEAEASA